MIDGLETHLDPRVLAWVEALESALPPEGEEVDLDAITMWLTDRDTLLSELSHLDIASLGPTARAELTHRIGAVIARDDGLLEVLQSAKVAVGSELRRLAGARAGMSAYRPVRPVAGVRTAL